MLLTYITYICSAQSNSTETKKKKKVKFGLDLPKRYSINELSLEDSNLDFEDEHINRTSALPGEPNPRTNLEIVIKNEPIKFQLQTDTGICLNVDLSLKSEHFIKQLIQNIVSSKIDCSLLYHFKRMKELVFLCVQNFKKTKEFLEKIKKNELKTKNKSLLADGIECLTEIENKFMEYKILQLKLDLNNERILGEYDKTIITYFKLANSFHALKQMFSAKLIEYKVQNNNFKNSIIKAHMNAKNTHDKNMFRYFLRIIEELSKLYGENKKISKIKAAYRKLGLQSKQCFKCYNEILILFEKFLELSKKINSSG